MPTRTHIVCVEAIVIIIMLLHKTAGQPRFFNAGHLQHHRCPLGTTTNAPAGIGGWSVRYKKHGTADAFLDHVRLIQLWQLAFGIVNETHDLLNILVDYRHKLCKGKRRRRGGRVRVNYNKKRKRLKAQCILYGQLNYKQKEKVSGAPVHVFCSSPNIAAFLIMQVP